MVGVAITVVCFVSPYIHEEWSSTGEEVAEHVLSLICAVQILSAALPDTNINA